MPICSKYYVKLHKIECSTKMVLFQIFMTRNKCMPHTGSWLGSTTRKWIFAQSAEQIFAYLLSRLVCVLGRYTESDVVLSSIGLNMWKVKKYIIWLQMVHIFFLWLSLRWWVPDEWQMDVAYKVVLFVVRKQQNNKYCWTFHKTRYSPKLSKACTCYVKQLTYRILQFFFCKYILLPILK